MNPRKLLTLNQTEKPWDPMMGVNCKIINMIISNFESI